MNKLLLSEPIQSFITQNAHLSATELALQAKKYPDLPVREIAQYIQARQKIKHKLPLWFENTQILYPVSLSLEQCSSIQTAQFKAGLVKGKTLTDLTGGFGIDSFYFSQQFEQVIYIEQNEELAAIAEHNFQVLGTNNVVCHNANSTSFLESYTDKADVIYLDPARRDDKQRKIAQLEDCEPNILDILPLLFQKAGQVLLKTAPMLDIQQALIQLEYVQQVWVVAVDNECKEVLYLLKPQKKDKSEILITTVNILKGEIEYFENTLQAEADTSVSFSEPSVYLYEPNTAVLKAGFFKSIATQFSLSKLHTNSHLYTSDSLINEFPGRVFEVEKISKLDKKELSAIIPEKKANIIVRNFPMSVPEICKKIGFKEGGSKYLIATTTQSGKIIVLAKRLK